MAKQTGKAMVWTAIHTPLGGIGAGYSIFAPESRTSFCQ